MQFRMSKIKDGKFCALILMMAIFFRNLHFVYDNITCLNFSN